jgi:HPr kinase/phosphorylase
MAKRKPRDPTDDAKSLGAATLSRKRLTVRQILEAADEALDLHLIAGEGGLDNPVKSSELNRPGLAFAGFLEVFSNDRIQIIGNTELAYLLNLDEDERLRRMRRICRFKVPCFIMTATYPVPPELIEVADRRKVPVLTTSLPTSAFVGRFIHLLEHEFMPSMTIHGVLMDAFGMGVLILGASGVGKSEAGLELIHRGHRLVADDVVVLRRQSKTMVLGSSSPVTRHHMEVRGLGIINVESLFGAGAVVDEKEVDLIVWLEKWQSDKEYDRLGIEQQTILIFDVEVPEYVIPVEPGRNVSILIEVAAMNQRLKNTGFNPARSLNEQLIERMQDHAAIEEQRPQQRAQQKSS